MFAHVFPSDGRSEWQIARDRALFINHPLYPELLTAHAACLRVGTPVDQLPHIEEQLAEAHLVAQKYSVLHPDQLEVTDEEKFELHHVLVRDRRPKIDCTCILFLVSRFTLCSVRKEVEVVGISRRR